MKVRTLWTVPSHVLMVGFAALFVSYADLFLEHRGMLPVPVLAVYLLLMALAFFSSPTFLRAAADARARPGGRGVPCPSSRADAARVARGAGVHLGN
jgi:hypothetical protein